MKKIYLFAAVSAGLSLFWFAKEEYVLYKELKQLHQFSKYSFSQQGEDLIIENIFQYLKIEKPVYLDIGAWNPVVDNNTFLFYRKGSRGVLVEPNPYFVEMIRNVRPQDIVVPLAVTVDGRRAELDYYLVNDGKSGWNTFSAEQAMKLQSQGNTIKTIRMQSIGINDIIKKYLTKAPDLLSIDIEGMDLAVLKSLDWKSYRPRVICVETLVTGSRQGDQKIHEFLLQMNYSLKGSTFVNSVYVDNNLL